MAVIGLMIFAGLVAISVYGFSLLPTGFVPQEDEGYCIVSVQLPDGASLQRTVQVVHRVNDLIEEVPGVEDSVGIGGYSLIDGSAGSNKASFFVTFDPWDDRADEALHQKAIVGGINRRAAQIQEAVVVGFQPPSLPGVGMAGGFSLQMQDRGGTGLGMLEQVTNEFIRDAARYPGIAGAFTGFRANTPQLFVEIDREQVRKLDIPLSEVFGTLQAYLGSAYVNDFVRFGRIYQVKAQADSRYRASPEDIRRLEVRNRAGEMIPLATVVNVQEVLGPQIVTHHNIYPSAKVNGFTAPGISSGEGMELIRQMAAQKLPPTMGYEWTDLSYQEDRASGQASVIFFFSIILVYLVLAAQYESWSLPMSVCLAVPTALLGAVAAIMLRQLDNNVYTQIGVVLLIGLSTKTAILIVEFAKVQREEGKSVADAAIEATRLRFRAVLMTAFSFILGVIPLLIATGAGAESRKVLGTTVFGGMLVATFVSVVTVPMLYFVIQVISEKLRGVGKEPPRD
jgi:HAE1 family hydrophobic/amphiphilic exporter-1